MGPIAALGGFLAGALAVVLARDPANTRSRGTWVGRGLAVGVAFGVATVLVLALLLEAGRWVFAGLAAVSGGSVGTLVGFLTWPDVRAGEREPPHGGSPR